MDKRSFWFRARAYTYLTHAVRPRRQSLYAVSTERKSPRTVRDAQRGIARNGKEDYVMVILVCGGRNFMDAAKVKRVLDEFQEDGGLTYAEERL